MGVGRALVVKKLAQILDTLTFNSMPIINEVGMFAENNSENYDLVVTAMVEKIQTASVGMKLPVMYAMDNVIKTVGDPYAAHFSTKLSQIILGAYAAESPQVRGKILQLFNAWLQFPKFFPREQLKKVTDKFGLLPGVPFSEAHVRSPPHLGPRRPVQPMAHHPGAPMYHHQPPQHGHPQQWQQQPPPGHYPPQQQLYPPQQQHYPPQQQWQQPPQQGHYPAAVAPQQQWQQHPQHIQSYPPPVAPPQHAPAMAPMAMASAPPAPAFAVPGISKDAADAAIAILRGAKGAWQAGIMEVDTARGEVQKAMESLKAMGGGLPSLLAPPAGWGIHPALSDPTLVNFIQRFLSPVPTAVAPVAPVAVAVVPAAYQDPAAPISNMAGPPMEEEPIVMSPSFPTSSEDLKAFPTKVVALMKQRGPFQCHRCWATFSNASDLELHAELHARKARGVQDHSAVAHSQAWGLSVDQWKESKVSSGWGVASEAGAGEGEGKVEDSSKVTSMPDCVADSNFPSCEVCGEAFEDGHDPERDLWIYKDTCRVEEDGPIFHKSCYEEEDEELGASDAVVEPEEGKNPISEPLLPEEPPRALPELEHDPSNMEDNILVMEQGKEPEAKRTAVA